MALITVINDNIVARYVKLSAIAAKEEAQQKCLNKILHALLFAERKFCQVLSILLASNDANFLAILKPQNVDAMTLYL